MNSKIFLTTPEYHSIDNGKRTKPINYECDNLGLAYLAAAVQRRDHNVDFFDSASVHLNTGEIVDRADTFFLEGKEKKIFGISSTTESVLATKMLAHSAKASFENTCVVVGGCGPTLDPELFLSPHIDFIVLGEGDESFPKLVSAIEEDKTELPRGVLRVEGNKLVGERKWDFVKDLDALPLPTRRHLSTKYFNSKIFPLIDIQGSRGCYARCDFCSMQELQPSFRQRSVDSLVQEVLAVQDQFALGNSIALSFSDINMLTNPKRFAKFIEGLKSHKIEPYISGCVRVQDVLRAQEMLKEYRKHFTNLSMGVESFNDEFLRRWKKGHTKDQAMLAMTLLNDLGINHQDFMIGADLDSDDSTHLDNHHAIFGGALPKASWINLSNLATTTMIYTHCRTSERKDGEYTKDHKKFSGIYHRGNIELIQNAYGDFFRSSTHHRFKDHKQIRSLDAMVERIGKAVHTHAINFLLSEEQQIESEIPLDMILDPRFGSELAEQLDQKIAEAVWELRREIYKIKDPKVQAECLTDASHCLEDRRRVHFLKRATKLNPQFRHKYELANAYFLGYYNGTFSKKTTVKHIRANFNSGTPEDFKEVLFDYNFPDIAIFALHPDQKRIEDLCSFTLRRTPYSNFLSRYCKAHLDVERVKDETEYMYLLKEAFEQAGPLLNAKFTVHPIRFDSWVLAAKYCKLMGGEGHEEEIAYTHAFLKEICAPPGALESPIFKGYPGYSCGPDR